MHKECVLYEMFKKWTIHVQAHTPQRLIQGFSNGGGGLRMVRVKCRLWTADCRLQTADRGLVVKYRLKVKFRLAQTTSKMQTADCRLFKWIMLLFPSLRANCKQAKWSIIQANLNDVQANKSGLYSNQSDFQANLSADFSLWLAWITLF